MPEITGSGSSRRRSLRAVPTPKPRTAVDELYRGHRMLNLLRDLALGEWSHKELAAQIGVPTVEISTFAALHSDEIAEVKAALAGQLAIDTAGLWISKRQNRVAELQALTEDLLIDVHHAREHFGRGSKEHNNLTRTLLLALKAAGEEYMPTRRDRAESEPESEGRYILELPPEVMEAIQ